MTSLQPNGLYKSGQAFNSLCREGYLYEAVRTLKLMESKGHPLSNDFISSLLQGCTKYGNPEAARHAHSIIISREINPITKLCDQLLRIFSSCGSLFEASLVFHQISNPSLITWDGLISAHFRLGEPKRAVELYHEMLESGFEPDKVLLLSGLRACGGTGDAWKGRVIHHQAITSELDSDVFVGSTIIDMYAKCGNLAEARRVFDKLSNRNMVSWNAMIAGYVQNGLHLSALDLFSKMQAMHIKPDSYMFTCILKACGNAKDVQNGRLLHEQIKRVGLESELIIGNALIDMYAKCASLEEAGEVFSKMQNRDIITWSAIIAGYSQCGYGMLALQHYKSMLQERLKPERATFLPILKVCGDMGHLERGRLLHHQIIEDGLERDLILQNTLVDMFAKCGSLKEAQKVFEKQRAHSVVSWGAMISGCSQHGQDIYALELYERAVKENIKPDDVILSCVLKVCSNLQAIQQGRVIHDEIIKSGFHGDVVIGNTLVDMYAKCGSLDEALIVFVTLQEKTLVSWGAMISGMNQLGHMSLALSLFDDMGASGILPDHVIFVCALQACGKIGAMQKGWEIHQQAVAFGLKNNLIVGNTLVDMYAKCGNLEEALKVFYELPTHDVISWGAVITGSLQHTNGLLALELFEEMRQEGIKPNEVIAPCVLKACGALGCARHGRLVHDEVIRDGLKLDTITGNALADMYMKCGSLVEAHAVFDRIQKKDDVSWGTLIAGYAYSGDYTKALQLMEDMQHKGAEPGSVIFLNILAAYGQSGLLDEGYGFFKKMTEKHGVKPGAEHYNCMIDLFCRAGCLKDAINFVETMPVNLNLIGWTSLLSSSRTYGAIELGRCCFDRVQQLDPSNSSAYLILANIYADAGMWDRVTKLQELQKERGLVKKVGIAFAEDAHRTHTFMVGDEVLPQTFEIPKWM